MGVFGFVGTKKYWFEIQVVWAGLVKI